MKHGEGRDTARDMYVYQHCTFDEIARSIGRSDRTVRTWAEEEGWRQSRDDAFEKKKAVHEKLHLLVDSLTTRLIRDAEGDQPLSPQALHSLSNLVNAMNSSYTYAAKVQKTADDDKPKTDDGISDETLEKIERQLSLL